jgi:hypothetical protein
MKYVLFALISAITLCEQSCGPSENSQNSEQCLTEELDRIKTLPELQYLQTLDGQSLSLEELFAACQGNWSSCGLYEKFYYWHYEVREIVSKTDRGLEKFKVRVYLSSLATCYQVERDPLKLYGDVAEFYNKNGVFLGLAVYAGDGLYRIFPWKKSYGHGVKMAAHLEPYPKISNKRRIQEVWQ